MNLNGIDFGPATAMLGTLTFLLVVDTILGAVGAFLGGTFKFEYLYTVGRTKGLVLFQVAVLMFASAITPFANFKVLGVEADPFAAIAASLAVPLAASLVSSILDNVGKKDVTLPQGVNPV